LVVSYVGWGDDLRSATLRFPTHDRLFSDRQPRSGREDRRELSLLGLLLSAEEANEPGVEIVRQFTSTDNNATSTEHFTVTVR